ncbi:hypothetical protein WT49_10215 [Burkholderia territorii]|nr:hypothetical protein WT49_10215 [Burkholderia territorii]KWE41437.1 hypothetical protein WT50_15180 [Burkholderia territorii]KWE41749.1 hypothetical protein WT51_25265 [Burkholderia territorii]
MARSAGASEPGMTVAQMQYAQFDTSILKARGLDPSIAEYFREKARFPPGNSVVQVTINGVQIGRKTVRFGDHGQLCFTPEFVASVGLVPIVPVGGAPKEGGAEGAAGAHSDTGAAGEAAAGCPDYVRFEPRTLVTSDPSSGAVEIVVPAERMTPPKAVEREHGGEAVVFNYRAFDLESRFSGGSHTSYRQLDTTLGLNVQDWVVRSHQYYVGGSSFSHMTWEEIYAQRSFESQVHSLQLGRTWTQDPMFGGIPFTGGQWLPEMALLSHAGASVSGVANGRAVVEVRQDGVLLYSTVVPAGPFKFDGISIHNTTSDLRVRVQEDAGAVREFVVPASSLLLSGGAGISPGLSVAGGRTWDPSGQAGLRKSVFATASYGWSRPRLAATIGGLAASGYVTAGVTFNPRLSVGHQSVQFQVQASRDNTHGLNGATATIAYSVAPLESLQLGLSGSGRTAGYRTLLESESTVLSQNPYHAQLGASVTWNTGVIGAFSTGVTRQMYFGSSPGWLTTLAWNVSIGRAQLAIGGSYTTHRNMSATMESLAQGASLATSPTATLIPSSNYLYATLTIPLGHNATVDTYYRRTGTGSQENSATFGMAVQQTVNDMFAYRASAEKNLQESVRPDTSLTLDVTPRYTSAVFGVDTGHTAASAYGQLSGGVVMNREGVALAPTPIRDTFAILKVGDVAGVKIETPAGPVWSGYKGLTAVPALLPFHNSKIEIDGTAIPKNVDVYNNSQVVDAARGAALSMSMGARYVHRVLLDVVDTHGGAVPEGLPVVDKDGSYFSTTLSNGRVMLTDFNVDATYSIQLNNGKACVLRNVKTQSGYDDEEFEMGTAQCE